MTVTELIDKLIALEDVGYGDKRINVECSADIEETTVTSILDITSEETGVYIQI